MKTRTMTCEECAATFPTHPDNVVEVLKVQVTDLPKTDPAALAKTKEFMMTSLAITEGQADGLLATGELRIYGVLCAACKDDRLDDQDEEEEDEPEEGGAK